MVDGLCVAVVEGLPVLGGHASGLGLANIEAQRRGMACHVTGAFFLAREGSTFIASQLRDGFVHDFGASFHFFLLLVILKQMGIGLINFFQIFLDF